MRCDYIAEGVIKATKDLDLKVPLIVRLKGTKEEEAKKWVCCLHVVPILIGGFLNRNLGLSEILVSRSSRLMN